MDLAFAVGFIQIGIRIDFLFECQLFLGDIQSCAGHIDGDVGIVESDFLLPARGIVACQRLLGPLDRLFHQGEIALRLFLVKRQVFLSIL